MPSPVRGGDTAREARLAALREQILADAPEPEDSLDELSRRSVVAHGRDVSGSADPLPTEVRVRLHGAGVIGHLVALDHAGTLLNDLQMTVSWIGARLRSISDASAVMPGRSDRRGVREATKLFLQPQLGAGSLIFHLVGAPPPPSDPQQLPLHGDSMLDDSLKELLDILGNAQDDKGDDMGDLTSSVRRMGSRVASALDRLADTVVKREIDLDVAWRSPQGRRSSAKLRRRGALALKDAVKRNREKTELIDLVGLLETASVGKDPVRIETPDGGVFKLRVDAELGARLGRLLHQMVAARAEQTTTWHDSGKETRRYTLLAAELVGQLPTVPDSDAAPLEPLALPAQPETPRAETHDQPS